MLLSVDLSLLGLRIGPRTSVHAVLCVAVHTATLIHAVLCVAVHGNVL